MTIDLAVQRATRFEPLPTDEDFARWAGAALGSRPAAELTIRLVDDDESRALNSQYRGKDAPTNVLSFPAELPGGVGVNLLGDVVICAPCVDREAREQGKPVQAHWAHLVIHGVLHLLGYDHADGADAAVMEGLEVQLLDSMGIPDPYS